MSENSLSKAAPGVSICLGGKDYTLKLNLFAFMQLEKVTGKNALNGEIWSNINATNMAVLLWAALLHQDPALTVEAVAQQIDVKDLAKLPTLIQAAFEEAAPSPDPEKKTEASPTDSPTPSPS